MHDPRLDKLAKLLVEYSIQLRPKENVLIESFDVPEEMTIALIRAIRNAQPPLSPAAQRPPRARS